MAETLKRLNPKEASKRYEKLLVDASQYRRPQRTRCRCRDGRIPFRIDCTVVWQSGQINRWKITKCLMCMKPISRLGVGK